MQSCLHLYKAVGRKVMHSCLCSQTDGRCALKQKVCTNSVKLIVVSGCSEVTQDTRGNNNDNNLFIQVEEESLAVKNTGTEGDLMRTFQSEVLRGDK